MVQSRAIAGRFAPRSEDGRYVSHASAPWWSRADPDNWQAKAGQVKNFKIWTNVGKVAGPGGLGLTGIPSGGDQWNGDSGGDYSGFIRGLRSFGRGAIVVTASVVAAIATGIVTAPFMATGVGTAGTVVATGAAGVGGAKGGNWIADRLLGETD